MSAEAPASSLTNTLLAAISQCKEQVHTLEEQTRIIAQLEIENERLRGEVQRAKSSQQEDRIRDRTSLSLASKDLYKSTDTSELLEEVERLKTALEAARNASKGSYTDAQYRAQLENLFHKDLAKQKEIDSLKRKLKNIKIQAQRQGLNALSWSSPIPSPRDHVPYTLPQVAPSVVRVPGHDVILERYNSASPQLRASIHERTNADRRKRVRSHSPLSSQPLGEISGNLPLATKLQTSKAHEAKDQSHTEGEQPVVKKQRQIYQRFAAVPLLAEDGESTSSTRKRKLAITSESSATRTPAHERLNDLLTTPTPAHKMLMAKQTNNHANSIARIRTDEEPIPIATLETPRTDSRSKSTPQIAIAKALLQTGPEDEEPFRSRPLDRLELSHFRINPTANEGLDYAFNEVVRGRAERRCLPGCTRPDCCGGKFSALARTLPRLPGVTDAPDESILLGYLGEGSEEKVRSLTPTARENLLHEAKVRLIADAYGKMHRDTHERRKSPPGFWSTDMPGTQENAENKKQARLRDRKEVERRHRDALRGGGKWIFADE